MGVKSAKEMVIPGGAYVQIVRPWYWTGVFLGKKCKPLEGYKSSSGIMGCVLKGRFAAWWVLGWDAGVLWGQEQGQG